MMTPRKRRNSPTTGDVLDFVEDEYPTLTVDLSQIAMEVVSVLGAEPQETLILKTHIVERILPQAMGQLRQQGGFAHAPQSRYDDGMGRGREPLQRSQLFALDARVALPERLGLFQQQRPDLFSAPTRSPSGRVVAHSERIA